MPRITVDSSLRIPTMDLKAKEIINRLQGECTHSNPAYHKAIGMGFGRYTKEPPTYRTWSIHHDTLVLPRGKTEAIREVFQEFGQVPFYLDRRIEGRADWAGCLPSHQITLWSHQNRVLDAILKFEQGIVRSPTGSGKTTVAIAAIAAVNLPTLIVVWNSGLVEQWAERLQAELGLSSDEIGIVGRGQTRWRPITIAMQQTLAKSPGKLEEANRQFGVLICDELQRFAADTFQKVVSTSPARYRIGLSADESRKDQKEFLIRDSFGQVIADISRHELEEKSLIMPVQVKVIPTEFKANWYGELLVRKRRPDFPRLLEEMTRDESRNRLIEEAISNLPTPSLILTHRREHALWIQAKMAENKMRCGLLLGGVDNRDEFSASVSELRDGSMMYGVGSYQAIGQGLDIKAIRSGLCTTPLNNRQFFGQVRGRVCRKSSGKQEAELVYLWDKHVFGNVPLYNLSKWNDRNVVILNNGRFETVDSYLTGAK